MATLDNRIVVGAIAPPQPQASPSALETAPNAALLTHWAGELQLQPLAGPNADGNAPPPAGLSATLNNLYHDGERYIDFCLAIAAARQLIAPGRWIAYVTLPDRFDFTLRTAQRRAAVGDVLLQLATDLSHLPRRAASVKKLVRLGPVLLGTLIQDGAIGRSMSRADVDALLAKHLDDKGSIPNPERRAHALAVLIRDHNHDWSLDRLESLRQTLSDATDLTARLCAERMKNATILYPHRERPYAA